MRTDTCCGEILPDSDLKYCPICDRYLCNKCKYCDTALKFEVNYCGNCGKPNGEIMDLDEKNQEAKKIISHLTQIADQPYKTNQELIGIINLRIHRLFICMKSPGFFIQILKERFIKKCMMDFILFISLLKNVLNLAILITSNILFFQEIM